MAAIKRFLRVNLPANLYGSGSKLLTAICVLSVTYNGRV